METADLPCEGLHKIIAYLISKGSEFVPPVCHWGCKMPSD